MLSESVSQRWSWQSWPIFTDYILKEFLFWFWIIWFCSHLKLSIDAVYSSCLWGKYSLSFVSLLLSVPAQDRDGRKRILFVFFILQKHNVLFLLGVHTNKSKPFTVPNDVLFWDKIKAYFNLFPLMSITARFSFHSRLKRLDSLNV